MAEPIKYEVIKELGVISESPSGWKKKVKIISWNGGKPKIDIRDWSPDDSKMGKGITLSEGEVEMLLDILDSDDSEDE